MSKKVPKPPLRIMVASTVHGFQAEIEQICSVLQGFGYEVWCSHKGTIPAHPGKSNLQNCLEAVKNCDLFLGILRPYYGTGIVGGKSITHFEMKEAVDLNKPRWFLVHRDIDLLRQLLRKLYALNVDGTRNTNIKLDKGPIFDDLRVIDMYNYVLMSHVPISERKGHWVQSFSQFSLEGMDFIKFQLKDVGAIGKIVEEMKR